MAKVTISQSMLQSASQGIYNPNSWERVKDDEGNVVPPVSLKNLWAAAMPGQWKKIDGDKAVVTLTIFPSGDTALRLAIPIKDGEPIELPLSGHSELEEGDEVSVDSIVAFELCKAGAKNITRYDGVAIKD